MTFVFENSSFWNMCMVQMSEESMKHFKSNTSLIQRNKLIKVLH